MTVLLATLLTLLGFAALVALLWALTLAAGPFITSLLHLTVQKGAKLLARFGVERLHERSPIVWRWVPVLIPIIVGVVVSIAAGDLFLDLAELMQGRSPQLDRFDRTIHSTVRTLRYPGLTGFFTLFTIIGTPVGLFLIALIASVFLFIRRRYRWIAYLVFTGTGGGLLNLQLKSHFERERPSLAEALREASGYSFPSGHAMGAVVVLGAIAYLVWRGTSAWRWRSLGLAALGSSILAIAVSRIYLGVHWISDIVAGLTAGLLWLTATTTAYETLRRMRRIRDTSD